MHKQTEKPIAWRWRDNEHQTWNFIDSDPVHMDYVFVEPLFAQPVGPEGFFDDQFGTPVPTDSSLQSAAREAGWALSTLVDEIAFEKRQQVVNIINRLSAALAYEDRGTIA